MSVPAHMYVCMRQCVRMFFNFLCHYDLLPYLERAELGLSIYVSTNDYVVAMSIVQYVSQTHNIYSIFVIVLVLRKRGANHWRPYHSREATISHSPNLN